ncbi:MAG: serine hydroxymethyltransferase [Coriobacteriales bacterium]|jgi:glycine hydroxymethyltransferase|nr:serine hydroxymethyltransferase [Coriobacteriales bacterium]
MEHLAKQDPLIAAALTDELKRQRANIELIASENFTSLAVLEAVGSVLTNKYAEGYPSRRYYGGCHVVDVAEQLAIDRACELFGSKFANVQPHSGASANLAAYMATVKPGDTVMGMSLAHGGHLSHGLSVNFSGLWYNMVPYGVNPETEMLDMDEVERIAKECRPQAIIAGASAYSRTIDFKRFGEIAKEVGAYLIADVAHIAGLIAADAHPSPVPYADIVSSTSHKTLRGPRGGFLLTNSEELAAKIDKAIFPGSQGGPLMHVIAGKAIAFGEALTPAFKEYAHQIVANMKACGAAMADGGLRLVSGGTDNHLALVDLTPAAVTGSEAEVLLEGVNITVNKNSIPNEARSSFDPSGIRVGFAAMTSRNFNEADAALVGELIARTIFERDDRVVLQKVLNQVADLLAAHPLYPELGA